MGVEVRQVFTEIPGVDHIHRLKIGAVTPSGQCNQACSGPVRMYSATGMIDPETVFEFDGKFFKNKEVVVIAGDKASGFEFRNPPAFMTLENPRERDAHAEVESLLDHLFYHNNTAPFISYRLIQRFGMSNPSPEYVGAVAQAFRTGEYNGRVYSGAARLNKQVFSTPFPGAFLFIPFFNRLHSCRGIWGPGSCCCFRIVVPRSTFSKLSCGWIA